MNKGLFTAEVEDAPATARHDLGWGAQGTRMKAARRPRVRGDRDMVLAISTIRPARKDDIESVTELWNLCLPYDRIDPSVLEEFFKSQYCGDDGVLHAEDDGVAAGFAIGIADDKGVGWIPVFFVSPELPDEATGDDLLGRLLDFFRARGVTNVRAEPFGWEVRFSTGIDSRYGAILEILSRNGFVRTDESQVDIVKDLRDFRLPPAVAAAREALEREGFGFDFCLPRRRAPYLAFMKEHFGGYGGWCKAAEEYVGRQGDPRLRILAFHRGAVVGFCAVDKGHDW